jgi:hypothetical protein
MTPGTDDTRPARPQGSSTARVIVQEHHESSLSGDVRGPGARDDHPMSTFMWVLLAAVYLALFVMLGMATLRKGHWVMFIMGIFIPLFWIIGALIPPAPRASVS